MDDMSRHADEDELRPDELDLKILEYLVKDSSTEFKKLAEVLGVDQRTVAKRVSRMRERKVFRTTIDIDWPRLGVRASAFVGSTTALGEKDVAKLFDFIKNDPRVVEAYATIGAHEYFLRVLETDLQSLRDEVLRALEPLTADLAASVISSQIKLKDSSRFLGFLRKRYFVGSNGNGNKAYVGIGRRPSSYGRNRRDP